MQFIPFSDIVMRDGALTKKVEEIVKEATSDQHLTGARLWASLAYSGVALGIESAQKHIVGHMMDTLRSQREMISRLDSVIIQQNDPEAIKALDDFRRELVEALHRRAEHIRSINLQEAANLYGLGEDLLMADNDPSALDKAVLQLAGHTAYRKMPMYFAAWSYVTRTGGMAKLQCRCSNCVFSAVQGKELSELEEISSHLKLFDGELAGLFSAFAVFLITEFRENLSNTIEGANPHAEATDAVQMTKDVMKMLRDRTPPQE